MSKHKIHKLVERGSHGSRVNLFFDYTIMALILLNVILLILETIPEVNNLIGQFLKQFEFFSIIIFTIEYLMRIYVSDITHPSSSRIKSVFKFIFSVFGLVDLLAIIPFYLPFLIKIDLRFIRMVRLLRFFRVFKINRYNNSLNPIWRVIKEKRPELAITGFVTLIIASFLMYHIEGEAQPDKFSSLLDSFWWAIATLTTVGYGVIYPITGFGKFISGLIAVLVIGLVALPTGIISAGFIEKIGDKNSDSKKCLHCGKDIDVHK